MRWAGLLILCLGLAPVLSAGAGTGGTSRGYGPPPAAPLELIVPLLGKGKVARLSEADPYQVRLEGRWYYGWRVCARVVPGDRPAFFLIRDGHVLVSAIADAEGRSPQDVRARSLCAARLENAG
ncbi:MAG: hypothetical protein D6807_04400 [Alphaproteobacteria bacterium]|nr:MAG: hypothetical protein D6807_04400 [Alphaproteobacteria bacterium]